MDEFVKHPVVHGGRNGTRKQSYGWSLACVDGRVFGFILLKKGNTGKKKLHLEHLRRNHNISISHSHSCTAYTSILNYTKATREKYI